MVFAWLPFLLTVHATANNYVSYLATHGRFCLPSSSLWSSGYGVCVCVGGGGDEHACLRVQTVHLTFLM